MRKKASCALVALMLVLAPFAPSASATQVAASSAPAPAAPSAPASPSAAPADDMALIKVAAGGSHSMAVKSDGSLWIWGDNTFGQLGNGKFTKYGANNEILENNDAYTPQKLMDGVIDMAAGDGFSLAVNAKNELYAWGGNAFGQLGDGTRASRSEPKKVLDNVASVYANRYSAAALKVDGSLWAWGWGWHPESLALDPVAGGNKTVLFPTKIMDNVKKAAVGAGFLLVLDDQGRLYGMGAVLYLGVNDRDPNKRTGAPVPILSGIVDIAAGSQQGYAINAAGELYGWGANGGRAGAGPEFWLHTPRLVSGDAKRIFPGGLLLKNDDSLWIWGDRSLTIDFRASEDGVSYDAGGTLMGELADYGNTPVKIMDRALAAYGDPNHTLAVDKNGDLYAWGNNQFGELGNGKASIVGWEFVDGGEYAEYDESYYYFIKDNSVAHPTKVASLIAGSASAPAAAQIAQGAAENTGIKVVVDGSPLSFDVPPQNINGRILVPLRRIFEEMGAEVDYDSETRTVTATKGKTMVVLTIGDVSPMVNGRIVPIDQPGVIVDGRTLAPLRFVAEAFGGAVEWDGSANTAIIKRSQ